MASDSGKIRYGLIGTGAMGRGHIGALAHIDDAQIVAMADPHEPSQAEAQKELPEGVVVYEDYREMIAKEELDAVTVAIPNFRHADIVCDALEAGLHVLGEKPMATTMEDCDRVMKTVAATGKIYQVGLELRYSRLFKKVREIIASGEIGEVRQLWCKEFRGPWGIKVDQWITQKRMSGGTLLEKDCHHFDLFNWFVDKPPIRVCGFGTCDLVHGPERFHGVTPDVLDNAQVVIQYEGGAVANLLLCMYCEGHPGIEVGVIGTQGWLCANHRGANSHLEVKVRGTGETQQIDFTVPSDIRNISHSGLVYYEHLDFIECIRAGAQPMNDGRVGWWSTAVCLAAEEAVEKQFVVDVPQLG
ncbi:MAG: Gfo/Idh/MocA family oxidoreductase [Lentisphaeria bacterium]|nr:Gfo/Idh/MocA family oxidoreductase [Lentisphaeria bacterium]